MNNRLETLIVEATRKAFNTANEKLKREYPYPQIEFTLRGTCAGWAKPSLNIINYNLPLATENEVEFLEKICVHESAHIIATLYYGPQIRAHGPEWKNIMRCVFGLSPERCHKFKTDNVRARRTFLHRYVCACGKEILVGTCIHNKIQANRTLLHKTCRLTISRAWYKGRIDKYAATC